MFLSVTQKLWRHSVLSVSHLVQMDTGVNGSLGLVAFQVGLHSLFTHAHGGKHLPNILKHRDGNNGEATEGWLYGFTVIDV